MFAWLDTFRLRSSNPLVRSKAVEKLSASPHDTELILASLNDKSPHVRCAAVRALERSRPAHFLKSLVTALGDAAPEVREAAAGVLGRAGYESVIGDLAHCLKDPEPSVRRAAAGALRALSWRPTTREEAARFDIALGNTRAALSAPTAQAESSGGRNEDTAFHRQMRAETLREKNDPARISALLSAAHSNDLLARISAIHDLGEVTSPVVAQDLLKFLRNRESEVRYAATQALVRRNDTMPANLLGLLEDSNPDVRLLVVQFFARVPDPQISQVLLPLLSDPVTQVRLAAANTIGAIGNADCIEELVIALVDEDVEVCRAAHQSLEHIDPNWLSSDGAASARSRLEMLLPIRPESDVDRINQLIQGIDAAHTPVPAAY